MTDLVAEANVFALLDDHLRVSCFRRTGLLIDYNNSDACDIIKPQNVITKVVAPDSWASTDTDSNIDFVSPSESFTPEKEHFNYPNDADAHLNGVNNNKNVENDLVAEEDEGEHLLSSDIFYDVEDFDSEDEVVFWSFIYF